MPHYRSKPKSLEEIQKQNQQILCKEIGSQTQEARLQLEIRRFINKLKDKYFDSRTDKYILGNQNAKISVSKSENHGVDLTKNTIHGPVWLTKSDIELFCAAVGWKSYFITDDQAEEARFSESFVDTDIQSFNKAVVIRNHGSRNGGLHWTWVDPEKVLNCLKQEPSQQKLTQIPVHDNSGGGNCGALVLAQLVKPYINCWKSGSVFPKTTNDKKERDDLDEAAQSYSKRTREAQEQAVTEFHGQIDVSKLSVDDFCSVVENIIHPSNDQLTHEIKKAILHSLVFIIKEYGIVFPSQDKPLFENWRIRYTKSDPAEITDAILADQKREDVLKTLSRALNHGISTPSFGLTTNDVTKCIINISEEYPEVLVVFRDAMEGLQVLNAPISMEEIFENQSTDSENTKNNLPAQPQIDTPDEIPSQGTSEINKPKPPGLKPNVDILKKGTKRRHSDITDIPSTLGNDVKTRIFKPHGYITEEEIEENTTFLDNSERIEIKIEDEIFDILSQPKNLNEKQLQEDFDSCLAQELDMIYKDNQNPDVFSDEKTEFHVARCRALFQFSATDPKIKALCDDEKFKDTIQVEGQMKIK